MNTDGAAGTAVATAHPNLALIKYWGKVDSERNLPATSSLGITLKELSSFVRVEANVGSDSIELEGICQLPARYAPFLDEARRLCTTQSGFRITTHNDFPTAAGLASSSSGFAALAKACSTACGVHLCDSQLSALARFGSASAARSVFGGFVVLPAGADHAEQLMPPDAWPDLRVVVGLVTTSAKPIGSREAMERVRLTSPVYGRWVQESREMFQTAVGAVRARDLDRLGAVMLRSYQCMFETMASAVPPIHYGLPDTDRLLQAVKELRGRGVSAWETMDAGPQVKVLCTKSDVGRVVASLQDACPKALRPIVSAVGLGVHLSG